MPGPTPPRFRPGPTPPRLKTGSEDWDDVEVDALTDDGEPIVDDDIAIFEFAPGSGTTAGDLGLGLTRPARAPLIRSGPRVPLLVMEE